MSLAKCQIFSYLCVFEKLTMHSSCQVSQPVTAVIMADFVRHRLKTTCQSLLTERLSSVGSNIPYLRSRDLTRWLESVVAFKLCVYQLHSSTPRPLTATEASLYTQNSRVFTRCRVDTYVIP